jgi:predicted nucleic acid-binding protein
MNGTFFLDTNLFIYSFDRNSPEKAKRANELIKRAVVSPKGIVSYQVVQEFLNVALKRFEQPLTVAEAEQYLSTIFRPILTVHASLGLYAQALRLSERYGLAWYDSVIVAAALEGQCVTLYSEDFQHGLRIGDLRIENPFRVFPEASAV